MNRIVTIVAAALVAFLPSLAHGQVAPVYQGQDGQTRESIGTFSQLATGAGSGTTTAASAAASAGIIAKGAPGNLYGFNVASGASAGVVQVFNSATIPADGTVSPVKCFYLAASTSLDANLRAAPVFMSVGIVVVFSSGSSCFTKTASATAFISADVK